mgnify:CR=1 FL=1
MPIDTSKLSNAVDRLLEALNEPKNDFLRDSVIQRFEFCVELSWKLGKKVMGGATSAPKDVIREMAQSGYVENVQIWLEAIDMRNLASHTYNDVLAEKVYEFAKFFSGELVAYREFILKK